MDDSNVMAARVVGRRAELGWFDVDFTMHGCAYLQNGKVHYKVSSQAEDIYQFAETAALEKIYTSNVLSCKEKYPVPSGMKDLIAADVKKKLARELKKRYPIGFFEMLNDMAERTIDDNAAEQLWKETEELEGIFSEKDMDQFEVRVQYVYRHHGINESSYHNLMKWIREERKNMDDNIISKALHEKTVYGFAYEKDGRIRYVDNALKAYVYEKAEQLEQEGMLITPMLSHTYWYEQTGRLSEVLREFRELLSKTYDKAYMQLLKEIRNNRAGITKEEFEELLRKAREHYGEDAANTILRYGCRWGTVCSWE